MMEPTLIESLRQNPVIAAVRDMGDLPAALESPVRVIFLLSGTIFDVRGAVEKVKECGKMAFLHLDLIEGLGRDETAVRFLTRYARPAGLITTRNNLIHAMRKHGIVSVQRLFLIDSLSLATGAEAVRSAKPDVVEVLPGIAPRAIAEFKQRVQVPVIAGGLIRTPDEVEAAMAAGATGVSVSAKQLWV